jgi:hypothetical protein
MVHALLDAAVWTLNKVGVPVLVAAVTAWFVAGRGAGREVASHDRRAGELNEDLRRWVRDRDREASVRMGQIVEQANVRGVTGGGALRQAAGKVYRQALHEYRDEATAKQRELERRLDTEGRAHRRVRRRRHAPAPRLALPQDCSAMLARWRERAEEDPTRPELEAALREIERPPLAA